MATDTAIYIYGGILLICTVLCILRNYLVTRICMRASLKLHNRMFSNLLHATMSFFHNNPSGNIIRLFFNNRRMLNVLFVVGRILNRFSKDTGAMDESLSRNFTESVQIFSVMVGILFLIAILNHIMIIPIIVILVLFHYARIVYVNTSQKLKGLESAGNPPLTNLKKF